MILMNINRDYLIILDVKSGEVDSPNIYYFNTDKNTSNLYVQMVIHETIVEATPIENALDYSIKANILKPNMVGKEVDGILVNKEKAIYEFKLPADCTDFSGNAKIEFEVYTGDKIATSFATKFKVHGSVLTEQNKYIEDSSDYPILKELMAEVKAINETAHELDTTIRTLQSDMIEANNEMKANESERQSNEVSRKINENARIVAEESRSNNEVLRNTNEDNRIANEQQRIANEDKRKLSENTRNANEDYRIENEANRVAAENNRISSENTRSNNEVLRNTNEDNRIAAEEIRKVNEESRISAENIRVTEHNQMKTEIAEVKAENAILMENDLKQANRMTQIEISDKRQYVIMEGLMNSAGDGYLKIEDTGNDTTLYNSVEGFVDVKNITGNTMVNSIKNPDDELTLNGDINTSGQSVTLTTAVDNGQVDVLAEGNTMVNVCDQQEAVAITKSYTVESGNHVALQGEYDGKCRPVVTGNTLVNIANPVIKSKTFSGTTRTYALNSSNSLLKADSTYSIIFNISDLVLDGFDSILLQIQLNGFDVDIRTIGNVNKNGRYIFTFTTSSQKTAESNIVLKSLSQYFNGVLNNALTISDVIILEGDYTNKPIPDYFSGMQSSFEDKVVTQEMVDSGKELAENLGKYKVEYKVTGKNKFDKNKVVSKLWLNASTGKEEQNGDNYVSDYINVIPNTNYYLSGKPNNAGSIFVYMYDYNKNFISKYFNSGDILFMSSSDCKYVRIAVSIADSKKTSTDLDIIQLEEGTQATPYEPYKESIKTYYLNSPLLEGDTIEESGGNVYHVHRYKEVVLDGSENWTPNIDDDYWIESIKGYVDTANVNMINDKFPVGNFSNCTRGSNTMNLSYGIRISLSSITATNDNIDTFKTWLSTNPISVVYELASPQYELISQSDTILTDSYVAGHLDFDTAVPIEKVDFKYLFLELKYLYPDTTYNVQFEADNIGNAGIILGNKGWQDLGSVNKGINKFTYITNSNPTSYMGIRGIGFNASNIVVTEATDKDFGYFAGMKSVGELEENTIEIVSANGTDSTAEGYLSNSKQILLNEPLRAVGDTKDRFVQIDGKWYVERNCAERNYETDDETNTSYKTDKVKTVYILPSPTYEPVEIAPTVNTYTDVTHITNNSTIPMNMPIVNSGYEIIAKPSTKYTVVGIDNGRIGDSTIVNGTITTPATITDNFLRPYGTGKTSKVMLLEGEPANIPGYFTGIKSVFEDKVTEDGKYACKVRVYNDLGEETVQTLYLDEPLYNTNNITIYNDKLGYWKNYDIRDYQDGDFGTYLTDMTKTVYQLAEPVFIPLIDNCPNWVIGSWDNCSIHFDSIIPLATTRYRYTGNVPSVVAMSDDVATVSDISDQQDSMIIDLATQVATMEMMLM